MEISDCNYNPTKKILGAGSLIHSLIHIQIVSILKTEFQFPVLFMKSHLASTVFAEPKFEYYEFYWDFLDEFIEIPLYCFCWKKTLGKLTFSFWHITKKCQQKSHNEVPPEWLRKCLIYGQSFAHFVMEMVLTNYTKRISVLSSSHSLAYEFIIVLQVYTSYSNIVATSQNDTPLGNILSKLQNVRSIWEVFEYLALKNVPSQFIFILKNVLSPIGSIWRH